ncbi:MAG: hypothetical protein L6V93_17825 [Clostridiales bacterium]|nr:MAG: hypothetical protein L6V93_17825 [Clostridiales bacterium]
MMTKLFTKTQSRRKSLKKDGFDFDTSGFSGSFAAEIYGVRADGTKIGI